MKFAFKSQIFNYKVILNHSNPFRVYMLLFCLFLFSLISKSRQHVEKGTFLLVKLLESNVTKCHPINIENKNVCLLCMSLGVQ